MLSGLLVKMAFLNETAGRKCRHSSLAILPAGLKGSNYSCASNSPPYPPTTQTHTGLLTSLLSGRPLTSWNPPHRPFASPNVWDLSTVSLGACVCVWQLLLTHKDCILVWTHSAFSSSGLRCWLTEVLERGLLTPSGYCLCSLMLF